MSVTDPIADMLTVLRNASRAKIEKADIPSSKLKMQILEVLKNEGYIKNYKHIADNRQGTLRMYLKFAKDKSPAITQIKRISKPGLRIYVSKGKVPRVLRGMGMAIISTPSGIVTDTQARDRAHGGEVVCYVW